MFELQLHHLKYLGPSPTCSWLGHFLVLKLTGIVFLFAIIGPPAQKHRSLSAQQIRPHELKYLSCPSYVGTKYTDNKGENKPLKLPFCFFIFFGVKFMQITNHLQLCLINISIVKILNMNGNIYN